MKELYRRHSLFFLLLALFIVIGTIDITNLDSVLYKAVCTAFAFVHGNSCADYYDIPIWNVYLSVAILAALYHVHGEIKISNKHLSSQKK